MKSRDAKSQSANDRDQFAAIAELFQAEPIEMIERIEAFPKYASRQALAKFLADWEKVPK